MRREGGREGGRGWGGVGVGGYRHLVPPQNLIFVEIGIRREYFNLR